MLVQRRVTSGIEKDGITMVTNKKTPLFIIGHWFFPCPSAWTHTLYCPPFANSYWGKHFLLIAALLNCALIFVFPEDTLQEQNVFKFLHFQNQQKQHSEQRCVAAEGQEGWKQSLCYKPRDCGRGMCKDWSLAKEMRTVAVFRKAEQAFRLNHCNGSLLTLDLDHVSNPAHLFSLRNRSIPTHIPQTSLPAVRRM